jgi:hypothetical protein
MHTGNGRRRQLVRDGGGSRVVSEQGRTPIPERVDLDQLQDLIRRRREARYAYTLVDNGVLESLITEARLYRAKFDASSRRQRDAARVAQRRKPTGSEVMANLANQDPEDGAV